MKLFSALFSSPPAIVTISSRCSNYLTPLTIHYLTWHVPFKCAPHHHLSNLIRPRLLSLIRGERRVNWYCVHSAQPWGDLRVRHKLCSLWCHPPPYWFMLIHAALDRLIYDATAVLCTVSLPSTTTAHSIIPRPSHHSPFTYCCFFDYHHHLFSAV